MILDTLGHFFIVPELEESTKFIGYPDLKALHCAFNTPGNGRCNGRFLFDSHHKEGSFFYYYDFGLRFRPEEEAFILYYRGDYVGHGDVSTEEVRITPQEATNMAKDPGYAEGLAFKYLKRSAIRVKDYYYPYDEMPSRIRHEFARKLEDNYIVLSEKLLTSIETFMKEDGKNIPLDYLHPVFLHIREANKSRRIRTSIHGIDTLIAEFRHVSDVIKDFHSTHTQVSSLTSALQRIHQ